MADEPRKDEEFTATDARLVAGILERLLPDSGEPVLLSLALHQDAEFSALPERVRFEVDCVLNFEIEAENRRFGSVSLVAGGHRLTTLRPLSDAPGDAIQFWRDLLANLREPVLRAQLMDLLLSSRAVTSQAHAQETAQEYAKIVDIPEVDSYYQVMAMARAVTIARTRRLPIEASARAKTVDTASIMLDRGEGVGVVMRLLDALVVAPRSYEQNESERERINALLDRAEEAFRTQTGADSIAEARREHANSSDERSAANRRHAESYLEAARAEEQGYRRMFFARETAELAHRYDFRDIHDEAVRLMQSISEDDMDWQAVEVDIPPIPRSAFRAHLRRYRKARDWRVALMVFLAGDSPAGSYERNLKSSEEIARRSIRAIVSRTTFGAHGLPERSNQDFADEELVRTESFALATSGVLLSLELQELDRRFGPLVADQVQDWLRATFSTDPDLAPQFAKALTHFASGRFADSARVSIPLIEAGARGLLLRLDIAVYRMERGNSPGRFPSMDFYIDKLETLGLDPDWVRAIRTMLLSPGNNARNLAAHGFKWEFTDSEAAVLLRLAGLFCAMPAVVDQENRDRYLAEVTSSVRRKLKRRIAWVWRA